MKLYRLGENEIRIHLTEKDLSAFSITPKEFDYDSTKGRRVIWELFDRAREETGFDAAKEKVYIQLYPKSDGSVELFVTKLAEEKEDRDVFLFSDEDSFLTGLSLIKKSREDVSVYRQKGTKRYLVFIPSHKVPPEMGEFAEKRQAPTEIFLKAGCERLKI